MQVADGMLAVENHQAVILGMQMKHPALLMGAPLHTKDAQENTMPVILILQVEKELAQDMDVHGNPFKMLIVMMEIARLKKLARTQLGGAMIGIA